ncbi:MAG: RNA methyltransferase [Labilithrix sp.]|nr:RNA methyltransferase [Labilithrix sp.]MCW5813421.1 RNA methyltransferase [Labilithrix sp.]
MTARGGGACERIHGHRAALAVLERRPDDVIRVACTREHLAAVEHALGKRKTHVGLLREHEIEKLAGTKQHEGICLEASERAWLSPLELADRLTARRGVALALDRVRNSYNIGAILRSAAFFGVDAVILGAPAPHPGLDPNAIRVAEGGCEHLDLARTTDLADTIGRLRRRGVTVLGTDGHADADALTYDFPRPSVLVLGNEREGLSGRVRAQCDVLLAIKGTGAVESLNVGVAAGVAIARLTAPPRT